LEFISNHLDRPDIFNYNEVSSFLKDFHSYKKMKNEKFSLRAWAKNIGLSTPTILHNILSGKRKITKNLIPQITRSLKLDSSESTYFDLLVDYCRLEDEELKDYYSKKMSILKKIRSLNHHEMMNFELLSHPLYAAILEMTTLKDFELSHQWIKDRLIESFSLKEIELALKSLSRAGLLEEKSNDLDQKVKKSYDHLSNYFDISSSAVQAFHERSSILASKAIHQQSLDEREFSAFAFNIEKSNLPLMKNEMREFVKRMISKYESEEGIGDSTYMLNTQLFKLTK